MEKATWSLADVMAWTGLSERAATRLLNQKGCPLHKRAKNQSYKVPAKAFREWYEAGAAKR